MFSISQSWTVFSKCSGNEKCHEKKNANKQAVFKK